MIITSLLIGGLWFFLKQPEARPDDVAGVNTLAKSGIISSDGLHWHPRLFIFIKGQKQIFPSDIGLQNGHQPVHTHQDASEGIIHLEFNGLVTKEDITLDKFFKNWGKQFNSAQILDQRSSEDGTVKMLVNGKENFDFENYQMRDGDVIEIRYE